MPDDDFGPETFALAIGVSRETMEHLRAYAEMVEQWSARHNLVSRASLAGLWRRHFLDSAQLLPLIPDEARSLVDLGSGAGFPGLVLAELLRDRAFRVVLYEATRKKCQFLAAAAERLGLDIEIRNDRIEDAEREPFDVVTARACAPLPILVGYAHRFWSPQTVALFLKGQNVGAELTEANKSWSMSTQRHPSRSDPSGVILAIRELHRARRSPGS